MNPLDRTVNLRNLWLLILVAWLVVTSAFHGAVSTNGGITGIDFRTFYDAASRLNEGLPLYQTDHLLYVYSPILAELLRPLVLLPFDKALGIWFAISAGSLLFSIYIFASASRLNLKDVVPIGLMLLLGFRFWPSTMNFGLGQINFLLLVAVAGMYWAESRGNRRLFALLITVVALVKIWILGLLLYLILKREWKLTVASIVGYIVIMAGLFTMVGWQEWPQFIKAGMVSSHQIIHEQISQSLTGFVQLHFRPNLFIKPLIDSASVAYGFVAIGAVVILAGILYVWRTKTPQSDFMDRLQIGFVIISVLILLPPFEDEYLVYCLPLLWTLLLSPEMWQDKRNTSLLIASGVTYFVFSRSWPSYPPIPLLDQQGLRSLLPSVNFFASCSLWLITLQAIRAEVNKTSQELRLSNAPNTSTESQLADTSVR